MSLPKSMMLMTRKMPGRISERRLAASRILRFFSCFRIGITRSVPYGAESGTGNAKGKAAFDGGEGIILRLTKKFGVVREGEMTRRESEPTQLDESGVSIISLLLPPTSESLLLVVMAFCTIQRRRQASAPICLTSPWTSSPAIMRRRVAFPQAEGRAVS